MSNDPISQLPEPYRVAWEILHESLGYYQILERVLCAAQRMARASWGMMVLTSEISSYHFSLPEFRALPDIQNSTIPTGHITSMAYVLARKAIDEGQGIVIPDMDSVTPSYKGHLMNNYLPPSTREMIANRVKEEWFASRMLDIPSTSQITAMAIPIIEKDETIGSAYLHRQVSEGRFNEEELQKAQTFLTCVAIGIKNTKNVLDIEHSAFGILATGSHELRTPAILIHGYAKLLKEQPLKIQEDIGLEKFSSIIQGGAQRILLVIDDLLDYARIELGYISKQGVNLQEIFNPIIKKYQPLVSDKHQTINLDLPESLDIEIEADQYLSKLIEMCIKGAHDYTPDAGEIRISIEFVNDTVQFRITDSGIKLTDEERHHFFEQYFNKKWGEAVRGSGLNLYLAKRVIDLWGGQIGIESLPEIGNTFWFTIPIKK